MSAPLYHLIDEDCSCCLEEGDIAAFSWPLERVLWLASRRGKSDHNIVALVVV